jgi:hypothetical protein
MPLRGTAGENQLTKRETAIVQNQPRLPFAGVHVEDPARRGFVGLPTPKADDERQPNHLHLLLPCEGNFQYQVLPVLRECPLE